MIPVGEKDKHGTIVTNHVELKKLYLETYLWRLRQRPSHPKMVKIHNAKERMFQTVLKLCEMTPSKPWEMNDLEKVIKITQKGQM